MLQIANASVRSILILQTKFIGDVVLASTDFANPLVGAIDGRVVHGHIVATLDSDAKQAEMHRFYASQTSADERPSFEPLLTHERTSEQIEFTGEGAAGLIEPLRRDVSGAETRAAVGDDE